MGKTKKGEPQNHAGAFESAEEALDYARGRLKGHGSVDAWELYVEEEDSLSIESRDGAVESLSSARSMGLAMRVMIGGRVGFSFTNDLFPDSLGRMVEDAVDASAHMSEDSFPGFTPPPDDGWPELAIADPEIANKPREEKIKRAMEIEAAAMAYDPRVTRVRGAEYEESIGRVWIANSRGLYAGYGSTLVSASVEAVAEDNGEAQAAYEFETVHHYDMLDGARVGEDAASKAVGLLGGGPVPSGRYPVVLTPAAAAGIISVLAPSVFGDAVEKHRSWLCGKLGEKVASAAVTVVDDGLLEQGPGAAPFDDEGEPSRRTVVIRDGVLESFIYDVGYGARAGKGSSGNGFRPAYYMPPAVDTTNWMLLPGKVSEAGLVSQVDNGILVQEFLGLHTADPVAGEFSLGVVGRRIEGGKVAAPVLGVAMAGGFSEVLLRIEAVADRMKFWGDTGAPAVLIGEMDISGQ